MNLKKTTQPKFVNHIVLGVAMLLGMLLSQNTQAQINLSTNGLPFYNGGNGLSGNTAVSFVVENTNPTPVVLQNISVHWRTQNDSSMATLWWSSTDLSGTTSIGSPQWSNHVTVGPISVPANAIIPTFSNVNIMIPGNSEIRFAIQSSNGIRYSGLQSPYPPDSIIASGGVRLKNGTALINGLQVGASGFFPLLDVIPRFFTGSIQVFPVGPCTAPATPQITAFPTHICAGNTARLDARGVNFGTNLQFQWQSSTDNANWTNIAGATQHFITIAPTTSTYYRVQVTCGATSVFSPSERIVVHGGAIPTGNFTINSNAPTAGNNFNSFSDFSDFLNFCHTLHGPIIVDVVPNSGPYVERVIFPEVSGSSATNTITINGNGNIIRWAANNSEERATVTLDGIDFLTLDSLIIESIGTDWGWGIHLLNEANNNTIKNSEIICDVTTSLFDHRGIIFSGSATNALQQANTGNHNIIQNNVVRGGYMGITLNGHATNLNIGNQILFNKIADWFNTGIYLASMEDIEVIGNEISRAGRTSAAAFNGIRLVNNLPGGLFSKNAIHSTGNMLTNVFTTHGIQSSGASGTSTKPIRIINNIMYNMNGTGNTFNIILQGASDFFQIYHNTLLADHPGQTGNHDIANFYSTSNVTSVNIRNNIFHINNGSIGSQRHIWFSNGNSNFVVNRNVYFNSGSPQASIGRLGNQEYVTFASWITARGGQDQLSLVGDPIILNTPFGNLIPLASIANNNGAPIGIPDDFLGNPRPLTNPDRGAFEYDPAFADLALDSAALQHGLCFGPTDTLAIVVINKLGGPVDFATNSQTVEWQINGPQVSSGNLVINSGTLGSGDTAVFYLTANLSTAGMYNVSVWLLPSTINQISTNDTFHFQQEVEPLLYVTPRNLTFNNYFQTDYATAHSEFLDRPNIFISEMCHDKTSNGGPAFGWPAYLMANNYIEITGPPGFDIGGYTLEQWETTRLRAAYTFERGTVFSPQGTMVVAVGGGRFSVPSPSDYYYHGLGSFTGISDFWRTDVPMGRVLKNPQGNIVDAVGYSFFEFPAMANVPASEWSNPSTGGFGTAGFRLNGPDNNTGSNWQLTGLSVLYDPDILQTPNILNTNVPNPNYPLTPGFHWMHNGAVVDSNPHIQVGPYTADGVYTYVASVMTPCGPARDSITITVTGNDASRMQFINNCPSPATASIDVWINNQKRISDLNFRQATAFELLPSQTTLHIAITESASTDTTNALFHRYMNLQNLESYIAILSGVVDTGQSPSRPLDLHIYQGARDRASNPNQVDLLFYHGSPDLPAISISEMTIPIQNMVSNLDYSNFDGYFSFAFNNYDFRLQLPPGSSAATDFRIPFSALNINGRAATIIASGFADTSQTNKKPEFGIFIVLPDGGDLIPLPVVGNIHVAEIKLTKLIKAYPNPTSQRLFIELKSGYRGNVIFKIMDANGRTHFEKTQRTDGFETFQFDVSGLAAGQYYIRTEAGHQMDIQPIQIVH
jgi:hypothetical protein